MIEAGPEGTFYELGIDVGAISTKVLLLRDGRDVVGRAVLPTSMEPGKLVEKMVASLLDECEIHGENITHTVATGQGRRAIGSADLARTEITAFARGAYFLCPEVSVAVDMGGHGIRVMKLGEMGIISDFRTNDKCSSGTGCFLDTMALALEVGIDRMGEFSLASRHPETMSTTCTVFAESEVVSLVAKGKKKEDILAGLNAMVARKIRALVHSTRSEGTVLIGGGPALNKGLVRMIENTLERNIHVPLHPLFVGALGAALLAPKPEDEEDDETGEPWEPGGESGDGTSPSSWMKKIKCTLGSIFRGGSR